MPLIQIEHLFISTLVRKVIKPKDLKYQITKAFLSPFTSFRNFEGEISMEERDIPSEGCLPHFGRYKVKISAKLGQRMIVTSKGRLS